MFQRYNKELNFENFRLDNGTNMMNSLSSCSSLSSLSSVSSTDSLNNRQDQKQQQQGQQDINFQTLINSYNENFLIISQKEKPAFINLSISDLIRFFSMPICTKDDSKTVCKQNCDCFRSLEIGMQIYDKGGVQSFNQFGNYLIGYLIEQQTDPMTRIAVEFDYQMRKIKKIHCPCKFFYCPHAFSLIYFRLKLPAFYAIRLPQLIYNEYFPQNEFNKFYAYLVEESRSLPIMCDYKGKQWTQDQLRSFNDTPIGSSSIYGYCHKSLLPISNNIIEEQARARKWISDLHTKRSFSYSSIQPFGGAADINFARNNSKFNEQQIFENNNFFIMNNQQNHYQHQQQNQQMKMNNMINNNNNMNNRNQYNNNKNYLQQKKN